MKWLQEETYFMDSPCQLDGLSALLPAAIACMQMCDFIKNVTNKTRLV